MVIYLLQVSVLWAVFYGFYYFFLRKETFFNLNRWYLLGTIALSLLLPLAGFIPNPSQSIEETPMVYLQPITIGVQNAEYTLETFVIEPVYRIDWTRYTITALFCIGGILVFFRTIAGSSRILRLLKTADIEYNPDYRLVRTRENHPPFSFLALLFLSKLQLLSKEDEAKILEHERAHIKGKHSLDILFIEFIKLVFWWNPIIHLYKKELTIVHEYLADAAVLRQTAVKPYGHLLIRQSLSGQPVALANNFQSQIKNRIHMMTRKRSKRKALLKYVPIIPLLFLMAALLASNSWTTTALDTGNHTELFADGDFNPEEIKKHFEKIVQSRFEGDDLAGKDGDIMQEMVLTYMDYKAKYPKHQKKLQAIVEEVAAENDAFVLFKDTHLMKFGFKNQAADPTYLQSEEGPVYTKGVNPTFAGCEEDDMACSKQKMVQFIIDNLKYPTEAKKNGHEGMVVVSFIVDKKGQVVSAKVLKDPGYGMGAEAVRVVNAMPTWTPGKIQGEKVAVQLTLPFKFKLDDKEKPKSKEQDKAQLFRVAERMPIFPGCTEDEGVTCSNTKLKEFISENLVYPESAKKAGTEGVVVIQFVVKATGEVGDLDIVKSLSEDCDDEVLRVFNRMNELDEAWTPGYQNGKPVNVQLALPISFKLPKEDASQRLEAPDKAQLNLKKFKMTPNPSKGSVRIQFTGKTGDLILDITDLNGKSILQEVYTGFDGQFDKTYDLGKLPKANYIVRFLQNDKVFTQQLSLQ